MVKLFLVISIFLFASFAIAQAPKQYSFTHYTTNSGLLSNQVNTVLQDEEGYIWTGTTDGLQRFDGTRYKSFRHIENDTTSLPSNPVWQILIDKKKNLWLLMSDGNVGIFDRKKFTFRNVPTHFKKAITPNTSLKRLITDEYGHLFYLLSGSEVITLNETNTEFSYIHNFFKQQQNWDIIDFIQQAGTQKYWLSVAKTGLALYDQKNDQLSYPGANKANDALIDQYAGGSYNHLFFDDRNRLWFITWNTVPFIQCYDLAKHQPFLKDITLGGSLKTYHEIKGFFQQRDGTIWVNGLLVLANFLEAEKQFQLVYNGYVNEQSIAYEMVHCLFEDREKNIWAGTDNNGLYRFNPATEFFTCIKHFSNPTASAGKGSLLSFIATRWGTILAGTWGDGLYEYDSNFNPVPLTIRGLGIANPFIWSMCASADSNSIWMSAQPGIYLIDQAKRSFKYFNPPLLQNQTIRQVAEDKSRNLWLGTYQLGVFKWTPAKGKQNFDAGIEAIDAVPPVQINKITVDSKGYIWVGTPENGVYVLDPATNKITMRFSDTSAMEKRLPERGISSILDYNDSTVIITTATRVVVYNRVTQSLSVVGQPGMISGFITAVEKDKDGYLWLTSTSGLYRIQIRKQIFVKFTRRDGLDNEHFIQSASAVLPGGRLLFGTTNDMVLFDPAKIHVAPATPDVLITDFKIMGSSVSVDSLNNLKALELSYQENSLAIEFSPLIYNSPYLIKYKMDGLDKDWKIADKNNEAIYSFLPPGSYTFLLKTVNEEGKESATATQLKIIIVPPFWKTWWFYSLVVLFIVALLFWLDKERMKRKEAIQKMRADIADNLYQDVNTALSNINILSEMAKLKADKDPEKSKEFIQQINGKSQQMMVAMDDMLWGISPENDSMQKTIERIKEHVDSLRNRYDSEINLLIDKKVEALELDMKLRQHICWFIKSGSTNIVRTGATECNLHIGVEKNNLVYTIEFNSTQSDMQLLNNILQRQELAAKLEEVKGVLQTKLSPTKSLIVLTVPLR
ncbi:MAG: hypothetical protein JWR61_3667 [Ferruginibacter sp.]|uniref:ligand-binding sensor domain-containing protein n=1 Tax=Ferruginibacter sp. TaxID=1940288 RepID=UPI002659CD99|nr:sensor histidine kinase [Ferruginibacter sp.]MDB5278712.1 hypothetical protein [Ferruginibacter sp.]